MTDSYIEWRDDTFYFVGSRVPLEVVVHEYKNGLPAESIADCFPTLSLEQIYGALAFYHANRTDVDREMSRTNRKWEEFQAKHPTPAALKTKFQNVKQQLGERR